MRSALVKFVLFLAIVSGFLSIFILFTPFVPTTEAISIRAGVSQAIATTFALISGVIAIVVTSLVSSSDYKAEQNVKEQTVLLLVSLKSLNFKSSLHVIGEIKTLEILEEKNVLRRFNTSTAAFAFWSWISESAWEKEYDKTAAANWRVFFIKLNKLIESTSPAEIKAISGQLIDDILRLKRSDRKRQSKLMSDINTSLSNYRTSMKNDVLVMGLSDSKIYESSYSEENNLNEKKNIIRKIYESGADDPDIKLFHAILNSPDNAKELIQEAMNEGANPNTELQEVLSKYR